MRALILTGLLVAGTAGASDNWWTPTKDTMPQLVAQGAKLIGFSTVPSRNVMGESQINRYVLQKDAAVYECTEILTMSPAGYLAKATCAVLTATE